MNRAKIQQSFGCRIRQVNESTYGHSFGGAFGYTGSVPKNGLTSVQLILRLNLKDPTSPLSIEGVDWLPLFYPFQYDTPSMAYRVISASAIEILELDGTKYVADFPYSGYPMSFPKTPVQLLPMTYEQERAVMFLSHLRRHLFWLEALSEEDRQLVKSVGTNVSKIGICHSFLQEEPLNYCPNDQCELSREFSRLETFATVWNEPVQGFDLWQSGGEEIQIIYQICPRCATIVTMNQCS